MTIFEIMGRLSGITATLAFIIYIVSFVKNDKEQPIQSTWITLTLVSVIAAVSFHDLGAGEAIWMSISYIFCPAITAVFCVKYGKKEWEKLDIVCFVCAIVLAIVWLLFNLSAMTVLLLVLLIDLCGLIPVMRTAVMDPQKESALAWSMSLFAAMLNMFAVETWNWGNLAYPAHMLLTLSFISYFLIRGRLKNLYTP